MSADVGGFGYGMMMHHHLRNLSLHQFRVSTISGHGDQIPTKAMHGIAPNRSTRHLRLDFGINIRSDDIGIVIRCGCGDVG